MVEGARLESVYSPKGYRGFESHPLSKIPRFHAGNGVFAFLGDTLRDKWRVEEDRIFLLVWQANPAGRGPTNRRKDDEALFKG